jgi:shikimate O-hydroxycinnamoyltransferase
MRAMKLRRYEVVPAIATTGSLRLSVLDLVPRLVPLTFLHFFDARLDGERLAQALGRTLASFPCLTGRMVGDGAGGHLVDWAAGAPVTFEVADVDGAVARPGPGRDAKAELPSLIAPLGAWRLGLRGGPLLRARLTRHRDGSVLAVSISHALTDMHGYCLFVEHWAAEARGERGRAPCHDRALVDRVADENATAAAANATAAAVAEHFVQLSRLGSVRNVARFAAGAIDSVTTTVHVPAASLAALKQEALASAPPGAPLSTHDALAAHLWRTLGSLRRLDGAAPNLLTSILNLRGRAATALPDSYFGNATLAIPAALPQRELAASSLSRRALALRAAAARLDPARVAAVTAFLDGERGAGRFGSLFPRMGLFANDLWVNNWSRFPVYALDFGGGRPFWFDFPRLPLPWFVVVAPAGPALAADGVDLHLSLPRTLARYAAGVIPVQRRNARWNELASA